MTRRIGLAIYRLAARVLLPPAFREEYGIELEAAVAARFAETGTVGVVIALGSELWDLVRTSLRERTSVAAGPQRIPGGDGIRGALADLRTGARNVVRRPGLASGAALTIALGIGATTTIYSVVDGVVLRPLPYDNPGALVAVGAIRPGAGPIGTAGGLQDLVPIATREFDELVERARSFESLATASAVRIDTSQDPATETFVEVARISPELLGLLGVSPALGRTFVPGEFVSGQTNVVLLGHSYWQTRYAGDPGVLGQTLDWAISSVTPLRPTIVGILPRDFRPPEALFPEGQLPEVFAPMAMVASERIGRGNSNTLTVIGRLSAGTTLAQARAELEAISSELVLAVPGMEALPGARARAFGVNDLHAETLGGVGRTLWVFLAAAALLLLLTVMNAATLLLARVLDRRQELGVRVALGAGRSRVVRLLVSEATVLTTIGGVLGVALAYGGVTSFLRFAPRSIPRLDSIAVDDRVLGVAVLATVLTGLGAALLPALGLTRHHAWADLHIGGRSASEPGSRLRTALVGAQLALATVLMAGAGLLFTSFMHLRAANTGFEPDGLIIMSATPAGPTSLVLSEMETFYLRWDPVHAALAAVPGVQAAAGASGLPFQAPNWAPRVTLEGDAPATLREGIAGYAISPGFLTALGVALRQGRMLDEADGPDAERVLVVNEEFVRTQLDGREAIGTVITLTNQSLSGAATGTTAARIVGVVANVTQARSEDGPRPAIYVPYGQAEVLQVLQWWSVARTDRPIDDVVPELRAAVVGLDLRARNLGTMEDRIAQTQITPRFQTLLIGAFAGIALVLAAAGLFGSLAHTVRRRQRELGIRMALGADRAAVLTMVMREGMRLSVVSLAVGLVVTLAMTRVLASFLYGIQPYDPPTLIGMSAILLLVSAAACLAPARRATAVDPARVLQGE